MRAGLKSGAIISGCDVYCGFICQPASFEHVDRAQKATKVPNRRIHPRQPIMIFKNLQMQGATAVGTPEPTVSFFLAGNKLAS